MYSEAVTFIEKAIEITNYKNKIYLQNLETVKQNFENHKLSNRGRSYYALIPMTLFLLAFIYFQVKHSKSEPDNKSKRNKTFRAQSKKRP